MAFGLCRIPLRLQDGRRQQSSNDCCTVVVDQSGVPTFLKVTILTLFRPTNIRMLSRYWHLKADWPLVLQQVDIGNTMEFWPEAR